MTGRPCPVVTKDDAGLLSIAWPEGRGDFVMSPDLMEDIVQQLNQAHLLNIAISESLAAAGDGWFVWRGSPAAARFPNGEVAAIAQRHTGGTIVHVEAGNTTVIALDPTVCRTGDGSAG